MSKYPAATREYHDDFCTTEKWELVRGAGGKPVNHHRTYELALWDGRILRTRISKPVDSTSYGASVWAHILRQQLMVDADSFWDCVQNQNVPDRGGPQMVAVRESLPLYLVRALSEQGVDEDTIFALTVGEAAKLLSEKLAEPHGLTNSEN
ncbi:cytotoxic translational repressor of toxin-antitoxin stability system [Cryobacterium sp. MDB2-33-2]|nr:cytotoxic translational repressor of toxin-antitoxin stability system [Cryobacterium sp. MDB2-33-2]